MYEELVKRLRNAAHWADKGLVITPSLCLEAADAIEKLQEDSVPLGDMEMILSEVAKPRWIPVTERLPKEMVLAHGRDGDIRSLEYSFTKKWWEDDDGYYCDTNYVTHWMPLPEPPKEGT